MKINHPFNKLKNSLEGEFIYDNLYRSIYATDASVYRMLPEAIAFPKSIEDIKKLILFASEHQKPLIPRTAGTSLAGQVVGKGIIVDISKYLNNILEFNASEKWVKVAPGIVRDQLNHFLEPYGLWFSPNTSTSNRCMIGGMTGNNSSGSTSIKYGVTRDKIIEIEGFLPNGDFITIGELSKEQFNQKLLQKDKEGEIYRYIRDTFSRPEIKKEIKENMPYPEIHRRNNGYALDSVIDNEIFGQSNKKFNLAKLIAGSEGTLFFMTSIKIKLDSLPPPKRLMVAAHFSSIEESMKAVSPAMKYDLYQCELMDDIILDITQKSPKYAPSRDFIEGHPKAILMLELRGNEMATLEKTAIRLVKELQEKGLGYAFPFLKNKEASKAEELRKAGLGLLGNLPGDEKAVAGIEDTAVRIGDLPSYISEFSEIMKKKGKTPVYYAHAGAGEIHLRPILNLKKSIDVRIYRKLVEEIAHLVHKYKGSLSGEHGSGIVRAEFIPIIVGENNYKLMRELKSVFDENNIFNPHKIVDPFPMDQNLRYSPDREEPIIKTLLDFSKEGGILRSAEKCNGSGDCRKLPEFDGTMCPSYQATRDEKDTTRARANALREFLTNSTTSNPFDREELYKALNLCLSCKACKSECPSTVDMAKMKAEFLYQYQKANGFSIRNRLFAYSGKINEAMSYFSGIYNFSIHNSFLSTIIKKLMGIAEQRNIPDIEKQTLKKWIKKNPHLLRPKRKKIKEVYVFIDEFSNYMDVQPGKDVILSLTALGYEVKIIDHKESGRSFMSKGFLEQAKKLAVKNVNIFKEFINENTPLIGIEPSAIIMFKDEYIDLIKDDKLKAAALELAKHTYVFEEFIKKEYVKGNIKKEWFTDETKEITLHVHCQQKAVTDIKNSEFILKIPQNYKVNLLDSGCCGMAGSFGYEREHFEISMKIGELKLFPSLRKLKLSSQIAASGTSCRHQIKEGVNKNSEHPASLFKKAIIMP